MQTVKWFRYKAWVEVFFNHQSSDPKEATEALRRTLDDQLNMDCTIINVVEAPEGDG